MPGTHGVTRVPAVDGVGGRAHVGDDRARGLELVLEPDLLGGVGDRLPLRDAVAVHRGPAVGRRRLGLQRMVDRPGDEVGDDRLAPRRRAASAARPTVAWISSARWSMLAWRRRATSSSGRLPLSAAMRCASQSAGAAAVVVVGGQGAPAAVAPGGVAVVVAACAVAADSRLGTTEAATSPTRARAGTPVRAATDGARRGRPAIRRPATARAPRPPPRALILGVGEAHRLGVLAGRPRCGSVATRRRHRCRHPTRPAARSAAAATGRRAPATSSCSQPTTRKNTPCEVCSSTRSARRRSG